MIVLHGISGDKRGAGKRVRKKGRRSVTRINQRKRRKRVSEEVF
jgi:hypothetical protein